MISILELLRGEGAQVSYVRHNVKLAYLFGSQARGDAGPLSDVDVAVLFAPGPDKHGRMQSVLYLMHELGILLRRDDVQVVDLLGASPLLRHRVYYDGKVLYCPDDVVRVQFETTALRDYVDTAPLRRLVKKYLVEQFAEEVAG